MTLLSMMIMTVKREYNTSTLYNDEICCFTHASYCRYFSSSDWFEVSFRLQFDDEEVGSGESFGRNKTVTFSTPTSDECYAVIIDLKFDRYAQDESWNITQDGAVVASSSPFADGVTEDVQELCLPEGDYVFTIYDAYGDGLCCEWGEGSYSVRTDEEDIIAEGAEFGPSESREFTLPVSSR